MHCFNLPHKDPPDENPLTAAAEQSSSGINIAAADEHITNGLADDSSEEFGYDADSLFSAEESDSEDIPASNSVSNIEEVSNYPCPNKHHASDGSATCENFGCVSGVQRKRGRPRKIVCTNTEGGHYFTIF